MDHEAAYKQLPLDDSHTKYAMVALRHPAAMEWRASPPHSIRFGAEAAVIHYNCYSRTVAILIYRIFGIPIISYYDDLGALIPSDLGQLAMETTKIFVSTIGYFINNKKTDLGELLTLMGLSGRFPNPTNDMTLGISLPETKKTTRSAMIQQILDLGVVTYAQLASLIGGLSFPQTSIFGRFGRPMMGPLYAKLNTHIPPPSSPKKTRGYYNGGLPPYATSRHARYSNAPDIVMFADAATSARIIAAVTIIRDDFLRGESVYEVLTLSTGKHWEELFDSTNLIYGLEMLALLTKLYQRNEDQMGENITFHIDNGNAFEALVKNNAKPTVITAMTHLIWHRLNTLRITPWFEFGPRGQKYCRPSNKEC